MLLTVLGGTLALASLGLPLAAGGRGERRAQRPAAGLRGRTARSSRSEPLRLGAGDVLEVAAPVDQHLPACLTSAAL